TGASRGIGAGITEALARQGAVVIGTATSEQGAHAIDSALRGLGLTGRGAVLDVGSEASVEALLADVTAREGTPAILVNNAGITRDNLLMRMKVEEWDAVLSTNLSSLYRLCKGCLRGMTKARYGRIVNIGSVVGLMGNPGQTNYAAAKAGVIGFTKALAREIGSRGVTVNAVATGYIETSMTDVLNEEQKKALVGEIVLGRLGRGDDVAGAVVYLASDAAAYVTGIT